VSRHAFTLAIAIGAAAMAACDRSPAPQAGAADLVIINGRAVTPAAVADAVAITGNTITRVGTSQEIAALRGDATRVIDAHGGTITAGFNDSHVHFLEGGLALDDVDLAGLTTLDAVTDKIRTFAAANRDAAWIVGRGWLYTPFPGGTPTKAQLDAAVADRPALMHCYDGHSVWVNSKALAVAGISKTTPDPPNGSIVRDAAGEPTGHLKEAAMALVENKLPPVTEAKRLAALGAAVTEAHRHGITSVQNAGSSLEEVQLYERARAAGDLRVRTYLALSVSEATTDADLDRMDALRKRLGDDATLKTGAVKIFADGVIESRTAAMLAPYAGSTTAGTPNLSPEALTKLVTMIDRRGWQIWIHAIGDRAIRMALDAIERAGQLNPAPARGRRHRLEHIETIDEADIPRFGKLGVIASQQPMHVALGDMNSTSPAGPWPDNLGPSRYARAWAWKSIQDAGGRSTFGSDWPVAPLDAMQGIGLAVTRNGPPAARPQRLDVGAAIDGYTRWPAYASFEEHRKGTLAAGMLADVVVLSTDLLEKGPATASEIDVDFTIFDGKVVYERKAHE
jgi:predicted amidohydrolase YtcJ